ncbi:hypothetical protein ACFOLF_20885 [Paenibacillus sepulcri]|uniref:Uncharacterized protein n=1 Tax=Paenibacillus sepulcri TaxID=359917 RepID=A0ABS7C5I5_9BACL|nr:hypothetical protein [Paenibacillus sepulcri]
MAVNLPFWTYDFGFLFLDGMVAAYDGKCGVLTLLRGNATDDVCLDSNTGRAGGSDAAETLPFPLGLASFSLISAANRADHNFSPYAMPYTWKLSNTRAASTGFAFSNIRKSIAGMVQESMARLGIGINGCNI